MVSIVQGKKVLQQCLVDYHQEIKVVLQSYHDCQISISGSDVDTENIFHDVDMKEKVSGAQRPSDIITSAPANQQWPANSSRWWLE